MDDAPPPPYALRDPRSGPAQPPPSPQYNAAFNAVLDATSVPIPYSGTQNPVSPISVPPTNPEARYISDEDLRKAGFVSAAACFELRIPAQMRPRETFYHRMILLPDSRPDNLPFPAPIEQWTIRGVDDQDWMTFLNHMFPPHEADTKYRDVKELEADAGADMSSLPLSHARSSDQSRPLLGSQPGPSNGGQDSEMERLRRLRIEAVASQWNEGFFGPRGLEILVDISSIVAPVAPVPAPTAPRRTSGNVLQKRPPPVLEESLLHAAVAKGKKSQVKLLLDKGGEDLEALNKKGQTALYVAVSRGDKDIVQFLLENGADPTTRPPNADSPLQIAVYHDRKMILKFLLAKSRVGIEQENGKGETLLYVALQRRHSSCIEALLDAGANTNARPLGKDSMLNMLVISDSKSIAKLLLQRGVVVEERNTKGESALFHAVSRGQTSMVKLLLEYAASPTARTTKGQAPLSTAVSRGDRAIVLLLLAQKSIDVEVEDENGHRPLYTAISRGETSIAEQLLRKGADPSKSPLGEESLLNLAVGRGDTSLTYLLLERGADFEVRNRSGETPLFTAVGRGDTSIVSLLLGKGAGPNTFNAAGESALQHAVYRSNASIVSLLVSHGADPDLNTSGDYPLYQAVYRSNTSIASILLSYGADPEKKSLSGESPLERAIYSRDSSIVSILLSHGADLAAKAVNGEEMLQYAEKRGDKSIIQLLMSYLPPKLPEK